MSAVIAYLRVSTDDQTCENQHRQVEHRFKVDKWFTEEGVSGSVAARTRPAMSALLAYAREGDTVVVVAIDRLGRNTIDVLSTVEALQSKGVSVISLREGFDLSTACGKLMLTMMAAFAQMERENMKSRQLAGLERARAEGKALGRAKTIDDAEVAQWRSANSASIKQTAGQFGISVASVKRACSAAIA